MRLSAILHPGFFILFTAMVVTMPFFAQSIEFRFATLAPEGSPLMEVFDKASAEIKSKTNTRVQVKYFGGGVQGDERDFIRKIALGQLDGAAVSAIGLSMIDESIRIFEMPGLFANISEQSYVVSKMWSYFEKKFEKKGYILLSHEYLGESYFFSKTKINNLADLKSRRLWLWGDDLIMGSIYRQNGFNGVPLGVPEVDAALTSGRIDSCYATPIAAVGSQWYTKVKFLTKMPINFTIGATIVAKTRWNLLSAEDKKSAAQIFSASAKKSNSNMAKQNDSAEKNMARKGVTISPPSQAMVTDFEKNAQAVLKALTGKLYSSEELTMVLKFRDEFRKKSNTK